MHNLDRWHDEFDLRLDAILGSDKPKSVLAKYGISLPNQPGVSEQKGVLEELGLRATPNILDELGVGHPKQGANIPEARDREPTQQELDMIERPMPEHHLRFFALQREAINVCYQAREQGALGPFELQSYLRTIEECFRRDNDGDAEKLGQIVQIMFAALALGPWW